MISLLLLCDTVSVRALNNSTTLFRCTCFVVPNGILNNYFIQYLLGVEISLKWLVFLFDSQAQISYVNDSITILRL
jgi:hypothetical protein